MESYFIRWGNFHFSLAVYAWILTYSLNSLGYWISYNHFFFSKIAKNEKRKMTKDELPRSLSRQILCYHDIIITTLGSSGRYQLVILLTCILVKMFSAWALLLVDFPSADNWYPGIYFFDFFFWFYLEFFRKSLIVVKA